MPPSPLPQGRTMRRAALSAPAPRRVIAHRALRRSFLKQRPHSPRGPLLGRGYVVLAVTAHTASSASLEPSRRLPVLRLYAGSLPYGRVLARPQTFPTLSDRSFPWCHRPYAGEPCGCMHPIPSPQALAFALVARARHSHSPQLALSAPYWELLVVALTTLQRSLDAAAPRFARTPGPADLGPAGPGRRALLLPGFHAQESPPERAGYHYLGNRTTPRAGLPPAGSMLLWAARDDELMLDHVLHIALQPWAHLTQIDSPFA